MVRAREVQNRVAQEHHKLLVLAVELAGQWLVASLYDDALANPLPELRLRRPELFPVAADHERGLLSLLTLLFRRPQNLLPPFPSTFGHTSARASTTHFRGSLRKALGKYVSRRTPKV